MPLTFWYFCLLMNVCRQIELGLGKALGKVSCPVESFKSLDSETEQVIVEWPPLDYSQKSDSMTPSMLALRKQDLLRLLLKALDGKFDKEGFINSKEHIYEASSANNSDMCVGSEIEGVEGDLALEKWFLREKWRYGFYQKITA